MRRIPSCQLPHKVVIARKTGQNAFGKVVGTPETLLAQVSVKTIYSRLNGVVIQDAEALMNLPLLNANDSLTFRGVAYTVFEVYPIEDMSGIQYGQRVVLKK